MNIRNKIIIIFIVFSAVIIALILNSKTNETNLQKILITEDKTEIAIDEYTSGKKEVLIIAPGWYMCKNSKPFVSMAEDFSKSFDVITMNFRGHCESSGRFTFTADEYKDLQTVINYARKKYQKVYVAGFSLGSATAVITQHKYNIADKLILVSPPTDFDKIENQMWKKEAFIPTFKKCELKTWFNIRPGKIWKQKIKPIDVIDKISSTPILIIAGTKDPTIHPWHANMLYNKALQPKDLIIFENAIHAEDIYLDNPQDFVNTCTKWLKQK